VISKTDILMEMY